MDKLLKVIVSLTAVDKLSTIVKKATGESISHLEKLQKKASEAFGKGSMLLGAGVAVTASLAPAVSAFAKLEDAQTQLKTAMMDEGGNVGESFEKVAQLAEQLGDKLPGNTADFSLLFETLRNNGVQSQTILDGVGKAAAYLGVALKMPYEEAGKFAAKMREATGVADAEMLDFLDTIARVRNLGVDADEMRYAFGRSGGALKLMGLQGLEASKGVAAVYAQLIRAGMSGETVGTGFSTILNSLLDPKKYGAMKDAAHALGLEMQFFKDGKFIGIENFVTEIGKLQYFSAGQRSSVVNALTGGGQDAAMLQTLITNGLQGYRKINGEMARQASLSTKVEARLATLSLIWEATTGTIDNMLAALGAGIAPELKVVADLFGKLAGMVKSFLSANPAFAKFIGLSIAGIGAFLSVLGVLKLLQGAFILLRIVMLSNPWILLVTAAIIAITLIYSNWDKIKAFFIKLWDNVKRIFSVAWEWLKNMFLNYTPHGLIIKHWDKIVAMFGAIWERVKGVFLGFVSFVFTLPAKFFDAGKNIALNIFNGIKAMAHKPIEAMKELAQKVRDFLPFSPAKEGALRDIHRVKIVETIADTIKPAPMVKAMRKATDATAGVIGIGGGSIPRPVLAGASVGGSTVTLNFNPTITGGGDARSIMEQLRQYAPQMLQMLRSEMERQDRKKYA